MRFVAKSVIHCTPERLFAFHELPDAFRRLLPPWERIEVIQTAPSLQMGNVTIVRTRIAPLLWVTLESAHTIYDPPHAFEDIQIQGPFKSWRHRHLVEPHEEGAKLTDEIHFEAPGGVVGRLLAPKMVVPRLQKMFEYRHEVTRRWCEQ